MNFSCSDSDARWFGVTGNRYCWLGPVSCCVAVFTVHHHTMLLLHHCTILHTSQPTSQPQQEMYLTHAYCPFKLIIINTFSKGLGKPPKKRKKISQQVWTISKNGDPPPPISQQFPPLLELENQCFFQLLTLFRCGCSDSEQKPCLK